MPELPEVETITRQLNSKITNLVIADVEVRKAKLFRGDKEDVIGGKVIKVWRRAKMIIIDLKPRHPELVSGSGKKRILNQVQNDKLLYLIFHLKMSGQLLLVSKHDKQLVKLPNKFSHVIFNFTNGDKLFFNEMRQFGWVRIVKNKELKVESDKLGIEPLSKDFTFKKFKEILDKKTKAKIKPMLMDQKLISGIGNIYASEICFYAKVLPTRLIGSLSDKEQRDIYNGIKNILLKAIKYKGTSADLYITTTGEKGDFEKYLQVYGRQGKKCLRCKDGIVKKIKLGGRGTFYCPVCQN